MKTYASILLSLVLANTAFAQTKPLIVLDTGHTPEVPGVIAANGTPEFSYNRKFVESLKQHLMQRGWDVYDVRNEGDDTSLTKRTSKTTGATLFLSIHHDSMQQTWLDAGYKNKYSGFSVFASQKNPNFSKSVNCSKNIGHALVSVGEKPSLYHAADYPGERKQLIDTDYGVHIYDNLVVLKTAKSPAVLLEVGVIVNDNEAERLQQPSKIQLLSNAVAIGLEQCR